jgi:nitrogen-specific signal transduction histidine kinase
MGLVSDIVDENDLEMTRQYENLMLEMIERVRQSSRLTAKSMLLTTLQHEIRQPLAFIYNGAELMLKEKSGSERETIQSILAQTHRIEELLDRLEKDSHMYAKRYSEDAQIIDLPEDNSAPSSGGVPRPVTPPKG